MPPCRPAMFRAYALFGVELLDKRAVMNPASDGESLLEDVTLTRSANVLRVSSSTPLRVLGCANVGDDLALTRNIVAMSVETEQQSVDPEQQLHDWAMEAGIHEPFVGLLTTAAAESCIQVTEAAAKWKLTALLIADLTTRCSAGKTKPGEGSTSESIDIIILTDASLSMGAMVSAMVTATEAKVRALVENRVTTSEGYVATGAPADSVIIGCLSKGERIRQAGPTTQLGYLVGKTVHEGLTRALQAQHVD